MGLDGRIAAGSIAAHGKEGNNGLRRFSAHAWPHAQGRWALRRSASRTTFAMFEDASALIVGDSKAERAVGAIREDVDEAAAHVRPKVDTG